MADEIGGVWRTIGGRRVFIKDGQDLSDAMKESGKFKSKTKQKRLLSQEESYKKKVEIQNQKKEYTKERDEKIKQLDTDYNNKKVTDDEYDKKWLDIMHEYEDKTSMAEPKTIIDTKTDEVLYLQKSNELIDNNKKFKDTPNANFTDKEKEAITKYTGSYDYGSYTNINAHLNGTDIYLGKEANQKMLNNIKHLDRAMGKSEIGGEYQLYRGIEPDKIGNPEIEKVIKKINTGIKKGKMQSIEKQISALEKIKGQEIETKGYMSTSKFLDPNYTKRGVTLVINTNKEDRAIDISGLSLYNGKRDNSMMPFFNGTVQTEHEVLYDRNTKLKIKDYSITEDGVVLICDTEQTKEPNFKYKSRKKVNGEWVYEY